MPSIKRDHFIYRATLGYAVLAELEQRVIARTAELTAANHELDAFAYAVSHDLRAPLRAMSGLANITIDDYAHLLPEAGRKYLTEIDAAGRKMGELIDALLTLSRSTRGDMQLDMVHVSAIAGRIVHRHGGTIEAHGTPGQGAVFSFTLPESVAAPANRSTEVVAS